MMPPMMFPPRGPGYPPMFPGVPPAYPMPVPGMPPVVPAAVGPGTDVSSFCQKGGRFLILCNVIHKYIIGCPNVIRGCALAGIYST